MKFISANLENLKALYMSELEHLHSAETQITDALVPELQRRGAFRAAYPDSASGGGWSATLRGLLGLPRPANRYSRDVA